MRYCLRLTLSLALGIGWPTAAATEEFAPFGFSQQASYLDQTALEGADNPPPGPAEGYPMPGDYAAWDAPGWSDREGWPGSNGPAYRPVITVSADAVGMERVSGRSVTLIGESGTGLPVLNANDLNFSFAAGPQIYCTVHGNGNWDVEVGYLGIDGYDASAYRVEAGNAIQFVAPGFATAPVAVGDALRFDYFSRLYTAEANLKNRFGDRLTLMGGFRWAMLAERFEGSYFQPPPVNTATPFWQNRVDNQLYGFQIGGQAVVFDSGRLRIEAVAKGGLYGNVAFQATTGTPPGAPEVSAIDHCAAFLGEASFTALWQASEHVALRIGYQALWLDGVALSPNQIHLTDVTTGEASVDAAGTVFFHGAVVGCEIAY